MLALLVVPSLAACSPQIEVGFESPDPQGRTMALARAAGAPSADKQDLRHMIIMLGSVDPAQRMLAIRALERNTGKTLGYRHYAPEMEREEAQRRWIEWHETRYPEIAGRSR
jgi:hypothetical protein